MFYFKSKRIIAALLILFTTVLFSPIHTYSFANTVDNHENINPEILVQPISYNTALITENGQTTELTISYEPQSTTIKLKNLETNEESFIVANRTNDTIYFSESNQIYPSQYIEQEVFGKNNPFPKYKHMRISYKKLKKHTTIGVGSAAGIAGFIMGIVSLKVAVIGTAATWAATIFSGISVVATLASIKEGSPKHGIIVHLKRITRIKHQAGQTFEFYSYKPYKKLTTY